MKNIRIGTRGVMLVIVAAIAVAIGALGTSPARIAPRRFSLLVHMNETLTRGSVERSAVKNFARGHGGEVRREYKLLPNLMNLRNVAEDDIERIRRMPGVARVELDRYHEHVIRLDEATPLVRGLQSQLASAGIPVDGSGVRVCVADTGIDTDHVMYSDRIDTAAGWDFVNNDASPEDDNGHGSHVAGIAVGGTGFFVDLGCEGPEPLQGIAPAATLIGVKILDSSGSGFDSDIIAGIDHCADPSPSGGRADVINLSIGTGSWSGACDSHGWAAAANAAVANGVVVAAAAGNENYGNALVSPACGSEVIAVGATYKDGYPNCENPTATFSWGSCADDNPSADDLVCFSNQSPLIDVAAPGSVIRSASNAAGGSSTRATSGTSMASPVVAGLAALILDMDPTLTPAEVRQLIRDGAIDMGPSGFDTGYGYGRVDVINTLSLIAPCGVDADCDDGIFCNGSETCSDGICRTGADPCPGQSCDENSGACVALPRVVYEWNMDSDPGWAAQGQWAYGRPTGGGGRTGRDPTSGFTGSNVTGYNLAGNYPNNLAETHLTTGAIDCSNLADVTLRFRRWLGVEAPAYDHAHVRVSADGLSWTTVWENTTQITDTTWTLQELDISSVADGRPVVFVRWTMGTTDGARQYCGWNIDDVQIVAVDAEVGGTCSDGIRNQAEDRIDCGGPCPDCACTSDADCDDALFCDGAEYCDEFGACRPGEAVDCDDGVACTQDSCPETTDSCENLGNDSICDDGLFCNGSETCDPVLDCRPGGDPCPGQLCDEASDTCVGCVVDADCDDSVFCNGAETCSAGTCLAGDDPCPDQLCDEASDACGGCAVDADCDDGLFCNGVETCAVGTCLSGTNPCFGQGCDEINDRCGRVRPPGWNRPR